jgi:nucleotide-binding universal stress UspA family protein
MYRQILVAVDGSETAQRALAAALDLARESGGAVRLVHAFEASTYLAGGAYDAGVLDRAREYAADILAAALRTAQDTGVPSDSRLLDSPSERLGELVAGAAREWNADLIVVGSHGRRGVRRALLGSGAEDVLRNSPVPVLTIPAARQG